MEGMTAYNKTTTREAGVTTLTSAPMTATASHPVMVTAEEEIRETVTELTLDMTLATLTGRMKGMTIRMTGLETTTHIIATPSQEANTEVGVGVQDQGQPMGAASSEGESQGTRTPTSPRGEGRPAGTIGMAMTTCPSPVRMGGLASAPTA